MQFHSVAGTTNSPKCAFGKAPAEARGPLARPTRQLVHCQVLENPSSLRARISRSRSKYSDSYFDLPRAEAHAQLLSCLKILDGLA